MVNKSLLKNIAWEIVEIELNLRNNGDPEGAKLAESRIIELIHRNHLGLEDMVIIDDLVQEILNK